MKVAIGGIMHESNTFATSPTGLHDFEGNHYVGAQILERWSDTHHEMTGFIQGLRALGAEIYPTLMASARPACRRCGTRTRFMSCVATRLTIAIFTGVLMFCRA